MKIKDVKMLLSEYTSPKCPARSNGVQLESKFGLFLDYLIINCKGTPRFDSNILGFDHLENGGRNFSKRVKISYGAIDFCNMVYEPYSNVIDSELCQLQLSNQLFYMFPLDKLYAILDKVIINLGLEFDKFNRVDVALDFEGDKFNIEPTLAFVDMGVLRVAGREKAMNFYNSTKNGLISREGVQVGKRDSSRFLRLYNKTVEMQSNYKRYIKTQWDNIGFEGNVWRYEYQLNSKFLRTVEGLDLEQVFTKQGLFELFELANKNFFELRYNTGQKETNKERPYHIFDWEVIKEKCEVVTKVLKRIKRVVKETLIGQQRMIKGLLRSYVSTRQRIEYILPLKIMLNDYDLWEWWGKKLPYYLDEFDREGFIKSFDRKLFNEDMLTEI